MASDFTFDGVFNSMAQFRERSTGVAYTLGPFVDGDATPIELLDGDEVAITDSYRQRQIYSIREHRILRLG